MSWYNKISREESDKPREFPLLEPGIYQFEVKKAQMKTSQSGNPMVALELNVWGGTEYFTVFDYLVGTEGMSWKIRHFADSVKLDKEYEADNMLPTMMIGRSGLVDVGQQEAKPNPKGGMYAPKNVVVDYVLTMQGHTKSDLKDAPAVQKEEFKDSDLPF
jgi:hypothetical protein